MQSNFQSSPLSKTIALLCIFFLNSSRSYANQKNSIIKGWKKIELLEAIIFYHQNTSKSAGRLSMKFSWNSNTSIQKGLNPLFPVAPPFPKISQPPPLNQQNDKKYWLPPLFYKIRLKAISFHISINYLGIYLSSQCLLNLFSNLYIPLCWKNFQIYDVHIPKIYIEYRHLYSCYLPTHSKINPQVLISAP